MGNILEGEVGSPFEVTECRSGHACPTSSSEGWGDYPSRSIFNPATSIFYRIVIRPQKPVATNTFHFKFDILSSKDHDASPDQARSQPVRLGDDRLSFYLRKLPTRKPLCSNAQRRPRSRMQNMYSTFHSLSMEARQDRSNKTNEHLPDLRSLKELLSVLHA